MKQLLLRKIEACSECGKDTEIIYLANVKKNTLCDNCDKKRQEKQSEDLFKLEKKKRLDITTTLQRIGVTFKGDYILMSRNEIIIQIQKQLVDICNKYHRGFYLSGIPGSGKTTNMQIFAHYMLYTPERKHKFRDPESFMFMTESNLLSKIFNRAVDEFNWDFQLSINFYLKNKKYIFIDEFASRVHNEKERQILDLLIHYIDEHKERCKLFITSNIALSELDNHFRGQGTEHQYSRVISRLYELCTAFSFENNDYRKQKHIF